jgi:hypothetical protein
VASRGAALALVVLGVAEPRLAWATESVPAARVPVHFATAEPGVTVYSRSVPPERLAGEDRPSERTEFEALCEAPCDATLDPTVHEFALAPAGSAPIPATPAFELHGDARFRADVISHASTRTTGWWILGILGTAGATSTTIGLLQTCVDDQSCQEWTSLAIWSGIAAMTAGVLVGVPKITKSDEAKLTLLPGTAPLPSPAGAELRELDRASFVAAGATFAGNF